MICDQAKFFELAKQQTIKCSLKSFSDTVLFYYLGYIAAKHNAGQIAEIGVGGSTYPLIELSEVTNKSFFVFDRDQDFLTKFTNSEHWPRADITRVLDDSKNLHSYTSFPEFSYCHVDGSKNFETTLSDLTFYINNLSENGLICQDDYGNSKWPTVTDAIKQLEQQNIIKIVLVGDSSVWITKPEYYDYWINQFDTDYELSLLKALFNIVSSSKLSKAPQYFFLQAELNFCLAEDYSDTEKQYFNNLLDSGDIPKYGYLKMPYAFQSTPGYALLTNIAGEYNLTKSYDTLKGPSWPQKVPTTKDEINQLPIWVKDELEFVYNIDIFKRPVQKPEKLSIDLLNIKFDNIAQNLQKGVSNEHSS